MAASAILPPQRVTIVGVLNVTPDSFSDGGRFVTASRSVDLDAVVASGEAMVAAGADVLDVGGESTRPGAGEVSVGEEIARTAGVVEALAKRLSVPVSIDTRKAEVAEAALDAGARIVNDVSGGVFDPSLLGVVSKRGAEVVLGHLRGTPDRMQQTIDFDDVVAEVADELNTAVDGALAAGISRDRIAVDPGIGFGKRGAENHALIANLAELRGRVNCKVWVGVSRKSFLGELTDDPAEARDLASHVAGGIAIFAGADAVRVHDVAGAARARAVATALRDARRLAT
jgi:dihydropteroate synthase